MADGDNYSHFSQLTDTIIVFRYFRCHGNPPDNITVTLYIFEVFICKRQDLLLCLTAFMFFIDKGTFHVGTQNFNPDVIGLHDIANSRKTPFNFIKWI